MRAIVKPWDEIACNNLLGLKDYCETLVDVIENYKGDKCGSKVINHYITRIPYHLLNVINEDEWDAEIYALLLIESGVIYE